MAAANVQEIQGLDDDMTPPFELWYLDEHKHQKIILVPDSILHLMGPVQACKENDPDCTHYDATASLTKMGMTANPIAFAIIQQYIKIIESQPDLLQVKVVPNAAVEPYFDIPEALKNKVNPEAILSLLRPLPDQHVRDIMIVTNYLGMSHLLTFATSVLASKIKDKHAKSLISRFNVKS